MYHKRVYNHSVQNDLFLAIMGGKSKGAGKGGGGGGGRGLKRSTCMSPRRGV